MLPENQYNGRGQLRPGKVAVDEDDMRAIRQLVEAMEAAIGGGQKDARSLDWED